MAEVTWREVRQVVDEELQRLPEAPRAALVLCYLEGKTLEEAARLLAWSKSTLRRRLNHGRELLRRRLLARGLAPMAALTASLFAEEAASAPVPATLAGATARAAVSGTVSPAIAALVEAGGAFVSFSKAKVAIVLLLAMSLLGAGVWVCRGVTAAAPSQPAQSPAATAGSKLPAADAPRLATRQTAQTIEIRGRVLGPDGLPKVGAKLLLLGFEDQKVTELGMSAADGDFTLAIPKDVRDHSLIAQADGTGIDFLNLREWKPGEPIELRLGKDQVIRGRIVNTEGKPCAGLRVAINSINIYAKNSLDSFLTAWKERDSYSQVPWGEKAFWSKAGSLLPTTTDAEGRFALHGAGTERLVSLRLHGAGIADTELWIINRAGFDPRPYNQATRSNIPKDFELTPKWVLHGPNVSVVAEVEKPIRGIVKNIDNDNGRPNVVVYLTRSDGGPPLDVMLQAKTDARGRYEIHGAHKAKKYLLEVEADAAAGYMASQVQADDTTGYEPITVDIPVKKGVIITGKVLDQATGKSVPGFALAGVLVKNPFAKVYPEFNSSRLGKLNLTADDGAFRIVTIPGPVLLMGGLDNGRVPGGLAEMMKYKPVAPDPKYPHCFQKRSENIFLEYLSFKGGNAPVEGNFCKVLDIKPGTEVVKQNIILEQASAVAVRIQDGEGRPVSGVWVKGISSERWRDAVRIEKDTCSVYHLEAGKPRLVVFYHPEKKLAGSLTLKGDEKAPVTVKLDPVGSIKGRLLDAEGQPLIGAVVEVGYPDREAGDIHQVAHKAMRVVTDADGAFTYDGLIQETKFFVEAIRHGKRFVEESSKPREPIVHVVKPGECRDLGGIKMKLVQEDADE
jgi:hypothetical protein